MNAYTQKARMVLRVALRNGTIRRPPKCERCNTLGKVEGHHEDYSKPLNVVWLCKPCHVEEHHGKPEISEPKPPAPPRVTTWLNVPLSTDLHRQLKASAVRRNMRLYVLVEEVLRAHFAKNRRRHAAEP